MGGMVLWPVCSQTKKINTLKKLILPVVYTLLCQALYTDCRFYMWIKPKKYVKV